MYAAHITQADKGCDFDFLEGTAPTPEPEIFTDPGASGPGSPQASPGCGPS